MGTNEGVIEADQPYRPRNRVTYAAVALAMVASFVLGLWFPRTLLPESLVLRLPSSCSDVIGEYQRLVGRAPSDNHEAGKRLRRLAEDRPDCFSRADREALRR